MRAAPSNALYTFPYTTLFRSIRSVVAGVADGDALFAGVGQDHELVRRGAADQAGVGLHRAKGEAAAREDGLVRLVHLPRSEEHTSELQSPYDLVCRPLLEKKK